MIAPGAVAPEVAAEHPGLRLWTCAADAAPGRSAPDVRERLRALSDRVGGAQALALRSRPVPHAFRAFFRQVGLDPDATRIPVEALVLERLRSGRFVPGDAVADALTIAVVETGVGVWALDAAATRGDLAIRPADEGDVLGDRGPALPAGRLVVADDRGPAAVLFGDVAPDRAPHGRSTAVVLFAVQVAGVPAPYVDEALTIAAELLRPA